MQQAQTPNEVAAVPTAITQLGKLEDATLMAAGYYEVFSVKGADYRTDGASGPFAVAWRWPVGAEARRR